MSVGGNGGALRRVAELLAKNLTTEDALRLVDRVIDYFKANAKPKERVGRMIGYLGLDDLKRAVGLPHGS